MSTSPKYILAILVIAQFMCTSLWFSSNAIMPEMVDAHHLSENALAHLTVAVQFGFITGTLLYAFMMITDRYSPSKVFFGSAVLGAVTTLGMSYPHQHILSLGMLRFGTGFFLAGIYPVGMKIAADYFNKLGRALGYLVGSLVLGTALPHLLKVITVDLPWKSVLLGSSSLSLLGGVLMVVLVSDGPYRKKGAVLQPKAILKIFKHPQFKRASFGYFGHMWELYTFWTFVPLCLEFYNRTHGASIPISLTAFTIIALGSISCVLGGYISEKIGVQKSAFTILLLSGLCCLLSPLFFSMTSPYLFVAILCIWGMLVIADSPLFSTMVANHCAPEVKGSALTLVNCIGFSITIISIEVLNYLQTIIPFAYLFIVLAIGPIFGVAQMLFKKNHSTFKT